MSEDAETSDLEGRCAYVDEQRMAERFRVLSDPHTIRALLFIARKNPSVGSDGAVCACRLQDHLGLLQPAMHYRMKLLREAGWVSAEEKGRRLHYRLSQDGLAAMRRFVSELGAGAGAIPEVA